MSTGQCAGQSNILYSLCVHEHVAAHLLMCTYVFEVYVCLCARQCTESVFLLVAQVCVCTAEVYITNGVIDLSWEPCKAFEVFTVGDQW